MLRNQTLEFPRLVELYNPTTSEFEVVAELRAGDARAFHTATRLSDGRVLIAGGEAHVQFKTEALRSAFIVDARDPTAVTISESGLVMRRARTGHTAVLLDDGRVLFAGGRLINEQASRPEDHTYYTSIEIYDPQTRTFTIPIDMDGNAIELPTARWGHSAIRIHDRVVLTGGSDNPEHPMDVLRVSGATVEVLPPPSDTTAVGPYLHAAERLGSDAFVLSGGYTTLADTAQLLGETSNPSSTTEVWVDGPNGLQRSCATSLASPRGHHTMTVVGSKLAVAGGLDATGTPLDTIEIFEDIASCGPSAGSIQMCDARTEHAALRLNDTSFLLLVGGRASDETKFGQSINGVELVDLR